MHLSARAACRRHLGRATEGRRATDTTDNQTQQVRAAVVRKPFPTSALSHDIHSLTCGQTSTLHIYNLLPTSTLTPPIPPFVCVTYVTEQPVLPSRRGIGLLPHDYSWFPFAYVSLHPGVRADVVPCSCYQICAAGCFC